MDVAKAIVKVAANFLLNYSLSSTFIPKAIIPPMVAVATSGMFLYTAIIAKTAKSNMAKNICGLNLPIQFII
tara:strand:+ start:54 stop:269 length:216 start_codon:yes stop_codon:yes gene_type:complete